MTGVEARSMFGKGNSASYFLDIKAQFDWYKRSARITCVLFAGLYYLYFTRGYQLPLRYDPCSLLIFLPKATQTENRTDGQTVIVLRESESGANEIFFDLKKSETMTKDQFILAIEQGEYLEYSVRYDGENRYPVSKKNPSTHNNLG